MVELNREGGGGFERFLGVELGLWKGKGRGNWKTAESKGLELRRGGGDGGEEEEEEEEISWRRLH